MTYHARALPLLLLFALGLSGCTALGYYGQSIGGQLELLNKRRPITALLDDPATPVDLKPKLELILRLRAFASKELQLPDNDSYRSYADLDRPYAVWNVFATPEFALTPKEWCFPFVGCVAYRGYFAKSDAEAYAAELQREGYDVHVDGVAAYSTLGWFHDPMLNTLIHRPEGELAGLMFHELAHQKIYVRGDSAFNESFATAVELEGAGRWLNQHGTPQQLSDYLGARQSQAQFVALIQRTRTRLAALYATDQLDDAKRAAKARIFSELRDEYARQSADGKIGDDYRRWFERDLNNARLVPVGVYHEHVAAFRALFAEEGGDWTAFYQRVQRLADLPRDQRHAQLNALLSARLN